MRHLIGKIATCSMVAGAALALAACGGGGNESNSALDNGLGNADLGNLSDPSALETMGNAGNEGLGAAPGPNSGAGSATGTGTSPTTNSGAGIDSGTGDTGGTDAGGDTGGNSAGGSINGM